MTCVLFFDLSNCLSEAGATSLHVSCNIIALDVSKMVDKARSSVAILDSYYDVASKLVSCCKQGCCLFFFVLLRTDFQDNY